MASPACVFFVSPAWFSRAASLAADWAEFAGYAESVHFWQNLDKSKVTIFYDSVCGLPLFKFDPSVRSFAAWKLESHHHGWPSFRPSETFKQNINFVNGGEMVSKVWGSGPVIGVLRNELLS
eukprot:COSAG01_NODE_1502_length_10101_cov_6.907119_5_plen_122_part_00